MKKVIVIILSVSLLACFSLWANSRIRAYYREKDNCIVQLYNCTPQLARYAALHNGQLPDTNIELLKAFNGKLPISSVTRKPYLFIGMKSAYYWELGATVGMPYLIDEQPHTRPFEPLSFLSRGRIHALMTNGTVREVDTYNDFW